MILPPYGLSGGSMRFDPGSLVLYVDGSLEEIQAVLGGGIESSLSGSNAIGIRSRLVHERDHFFRHLSTSYGFFRHGQHSLMVRQFYAIAANADPSTPMTLNGLIGPELRKILRASPPPEILSQLSQNARTRPTLMYLASLECVLAMDGDAPFLDRDLLSNGIAMWESVAQTLSGRSGEGLRNFALNKMPPERLMAYADSADPFVPRVKGKPLGAAHILEFFGVLIEFAYLSNQGVDRIETSDLLGQEEYFRLSSVFFGDFFQEELKDGRFPAFPVELEAAADLALAIPLSPRGLGSVDRPLSWFDMQPGWRFLQICDYFKTTKRPWTHISPRDDSFDNYDEAFRRIQNEVCADLGWPSVQQLDSEWQAMLGELQTKAVSHPLCVDLRGSGRQRIGRHLLSERIQSPYSMYLKRRSGAVDRELFFPAAVSDEGMTAFGGLHWKTDDADPVNWDEYLLLTGMRFFSEGATRHPQMRYDHAVGAGELLSRCAPMFGADRERMEQLLADYLNLDTYRSVERDFTKKAVSRPADDSRPR